MTDQITVVSTNEATWDDLVAVVGTDYPSRCLCQRYKIRDKDRSSGTPRCSPTGCTSSPLCDT